MASIDSKSQPPQRAWVLTETKGGIEKRLKLINVEEKPRHIRSLKDDHVLVQVSHAGLNPADYKLPETFLLGRFMYPNLSTPGLDFCGRIVRTAEKFAPDSRYLVPGTLVFGRHNMPNPQGNLATLVSIHKDYVFPLDESISPVDGAALPTAAVTAYQSIEPFTRPGQKIFITGGSGGVGTFAIQIAKQLGLEVTVSCSEAGAQLCRDMGADTILDYKSPTFLSDLHENEFDLVLDLVGNDKNLHRKSEAFLKPEGHFILVAAMVEDFAGVRSMMASAFLPRWLGGPSRKWKLIFTNDDQVVFKQLAEWLSAGKIKAVIDTVFAIEDAPRAFEKLKTGRTKGKIIVNMQS